MKANEEYQKTVDAEIESIVSKLELDKDLEAKVDRALHANSQIDCENISVHVAGRRVFLEGMVPSENQRILAQKCLENIFGIWAVSNGITFPRQYRQQG